MDFFVPCWIILSQIFSFTPSVSYFKKQFPLMEQRMLICNRIGNEARKQEVDPILAISVAMLESSFSNSTSTKGAIGPLGVIPKYHCPKKGKCDYTKAGVKALNKFLDLHPNDRCTALAQYNKGLDGVCKEGNSEYKYAIYVLGLYNMVCEATDMCKVC